MTHYTSTQENWVARVMDLSARKTALRLFSNGVYVITSRDGSKFGAATVTWISQASFKPPLIMAAIRPESSVFKCLSRSGVAALHVVDCSLRQALNPSHGNVDFEAETRALACRNVSAADSGVMSRCGPPSSSNPTMNLRIAAERSKGG